MGCCLISQWGTGFSSATVQVEAKGCNFLSTISNIEGWIGNGAIYICIYVSICIYSFGLFYEVGCVCVLFEIYKEMP